MIWSLPDETLLPSAKWNATDQDEITRIGAILSDKLDELGCRCEVERVISGPQITRFELVPRQGLSVRKIPPLSDDIAFELAVESVRIIAPIPGKKAIGIEIPTPTRSTVMLRDVISAAETPMTVALGVDADGETISADIRKMPHLLVAGMTGAGKALAIETPIPTPNGWMMIAGLKAGDTVFDDQGKSCTVTKAWDIKYDRPCYELTFSDGSKIVADADHQWDTWTEKARRSEYMANRPKNPSSPFGRDQSNKRERVSTKTTKEIAESLRVRQNKLNHSIPTTQPLDLPDINLPINPYVLGYWLGDGTSNNGQITTYDRHEIIPEIQRRGYNVSIQSTPGVVNIVGLITALRAHNLIKNKHIPRIYLRASHQQRLDLLQGLMDSDGSYGKNCEFYSTNEPLANQTYELICSLGIKATMRSKPAMYRGKNCGLVFTIAFSTTLPVFKLPRKLEKQEKANPRAFINDHRYIVDVKSVKSVPVRCIEVDSPSHLYLAGRSFIPTHNSVSLNTMLCSLLMRADPDELGLIMIDPKQVEFSAYNDIPHLMQPVVTDVDLAADTLDWLVQEMEDRYKFCDHYRVRNLEELNRELPVGERFPYLLCVIDEVADLMITHKKQVEASIIRLGQKARAAGIHIVLATQSPRVGVITGLIKANIPARIGFTTSQSIDSRVILDQNGCESLLGKGDALYLPGDSGNSIRFQGAFIGTEEVERITEHWRMQIREMEVAA